MSAINYVPYPRGKGYYGASSLKANTIVRLILANNRFKQDIDELRRCFKITPPYTMFDPNFMPRPYCPEFFAPPSTKEAILDDLEFRRAVEGIAERLNFDGNMENLVKDYALYGDDELFFMPHFRKSVLATSEVDEKGRPYINLKLYGPVVIKDVEAAWNQFEGQIKAWYPLASKKSPLHIDNAGVYLLVYELSIAGLSDSEIALTLQANEADTYTDNEIHKIIGRVQKQIDKLYR